jgi:spermidine/putrescine transport system substrate-binding protein
MTDNESIRILASPEATKRLSRRAFMAGMSVTAVGGSVLLSACGNSSGGGSSATAAGGGMTATGAPESELLVYNWAAYDDPKLWKQFTADMGPKVTVDIFDSNEQAIAKLNTAGAGQSGYDLVVPTGVYIPLMAQQGLLEELNLDLIPNFKNIADVYKSQAWDPSNKYSVTKDWGSTGWIYDNTVIKRPIKTWADFVDVMQNEAKNNTSILDTPANLCSLYFWTQNPVGDWTTTDQAELAKCQDYVLKQVAPNVKAYDSYPGINLTQGKYALSMVWNGDARQGLISTKTPDRYTWGLGSPATELWMDNWCIVKNPPHPNAAYAWINYILDPKNSYIDMQYHGYNTGIPSIETQAKKDKVPYLDMVFFNNSQVQTMQAGSIDNIDQLNNIYTAAKAVSAG